MNNPFPNKYGKSDDFTNMPLMQCPYNQYLPPYNPSFQPFQNRNENVPWPQNMQNLERNESNNPRPMQFMRNIPNNETEVV